MYIKPAPSSLLSQHPILQQTYQHSPTCLGKTNNTDFFSFGGAAGKILLQIAFTEL